jgi:hypothetical protein
MWDSSVFCECEIRTRNLSRVHNLLNHYTTESRLEGGE